MAQLDTFPVTSPADWKGWLAVLVAGSWVMSVGTRFHVPVWQGHRQSLDPLVCCWADAAWGKILPYDTT